LETEWVLRRLYGYTTEQVCEALKAVFGLPIVQLEDSAAVNQALDWHSLGLDFADALHLASRAGGAETFMTFDERLVKKSRLLGIHGVKLP
jgi:predicted nucleic acid-binding protein